MYNFFFGHFFVRQSDSNVVHGTVLVSRDFFLLNSHIELNFAIVCLNSGPWIKIFLVFQGLIGWSPKFAMLKKFDTCWVRIQKIAYLML